MIIDVPCTWHPHLCQRTGNLSLTKWFVTFGGWWNPHDIRSEPMEGLIHPQKKTRTTNILPMNHNTKGSENMSFNSRQVKCWPCHIGVWKWGTHFFLTNLWPIITLPLKIAITGGLNAIFRSTPKYHTKFLGHTYSHSTIRNLPMTYTQFYQSNWWTSPKKSSPPKKGEAPWSPACVEPSVWSAPVVSVDPPLNSCDELKLRRFLQKIREWNMKHGELKKLWFMHIRNGCGNVL